MKKAIDIYKEEFTSRTRSAHAHEFATDYRTDAIKALEEEMRELKDLLYKKWKTSEDVIEALVKAANNDTATKARNHYNLGINKLLSGVEDYTSTQRKTLTMLKNVDI